MSFTMPPMEAKSVETLPTGKQWVYEPKWDGFRCLAYKNKGKISLRSKSGKPLERYFPDILKALEKIRAPAFALDGELIVMIGKKLSFADLQLRLHPSAKRVAMLAGQNPAAFVLFDCLQDAEGNDIKIQPFAKRRATLEAFFKRHAKTNPVLQLSPQTASFTAAQKWLKTMKGTVDGIVAKNITDAYAPGERKMQKFKPLKTADCVVGGFRYASKGTLVGSLLLGLYNKDGLLDHVGFTSNMPRDDRKALTMKLEKLISPPGFTGNAPGGPSRWSTERSAQWKPLKPKLVVEVSYDHVSADRFRHGTSFMRWRTDKLPKACTKDQIL